MKFALVDGIRQTPEPKRIGLCSFCGAEVISKCGPKRSWHWAHKGKLECDPWWENETEWHRSWKAHFPREWQEVIQYAESGEKHIADIKTDQNWVIEFQHSYLNPIEREARNEFYGKLAWVVDAKRLPGDEKRFATALDSGTRIGPAIRIAPDKFRLLRDWNGSRGPVFFDFGLSTATPEKSCLWLLLPNSPDGMTYLLPYLRSDFIEICQNGASEKARELEKLLNDWPALVENYNRHIANAARAQSQNTLGLLLNNSRLMRSRRGNRRIF